jgi:hypothetical protein
LVTQIKGSSRMPRQESHTLRGRLPTVRTNNYLGATVGGATWRTSNVENQKNV